MGGITSKPIVGDLFQAMLNRVRRWKDEVNCGPGVCVGDVQIIVAMDGSCVLRAELSSTGVDAGRNLLSRIRPDVREFDFRNIECLIHGIGSIREIFNHDGEEED